MHPAFAYTIFALIIGGVIFGGIALRRSMSQPKERSFKHTFDQRERD